MSKKYIEADALIKSLATETGCMDRVFHAMDVADMVKNFPAADVRENVRGEWTMLDPDEYLLPFRCSHCNRNSENKYDFCPNCGADMRGEEHDN